MNNRLRARAMTLVEMLLAMSISTGLCLAISLAFKASVDATTINDAQFRCTQTARIALNRLVAEIRQADAIEVDSVHTRIKVIPIAEDLRIGEIYREYAFEPTTQSITLQIFHAGNIGGPKEELAAHVSSCSFMRGGALKSAAEGGQSTAISITCSIGACTVTLNGAASVRRLGR